MAKPKQQDKKQKKSQLPEYRRVKEMIRESQGHMKYLCCIFLLFSPMLWGIVYFVIWTELKYTRLSTPSWVELLEYYVDADLSYVFTFLLVSAYILEFSMFRSLTTDSSDYCRIHLYVMPFLWTLIVLAFIAVIWGCIDPYLIGHNVGKLFSIIGSVTSLIVGALKHYVRALSAHVRLLRIHESMHILRNIPAGRG